MSVQLEEVDMGKNAVKQSYVTVAEAAERLECDKQTVYRYIQNGTLSAGKYGGKSFKINRAKFEAFIAQFTK